MSDPKPIRLRNVDLQRIKNAGELAATPPEKDNIWYIHTVLAQCFLPYKDPKTDRWQRKNGDFSIALVAGDIEDARTNNGWKTIGLPYGPKPRLLDQRAHLNRNLRLRITLFLANAYMEIYEGESLTSVHHESP